MLKAPVSATINGGAGEMRADTTGVKLKGPATDISDQLGGSVKLANGKLLMDAPQGLELSCGPNKLRLAPDGIYLNGIRLDMEAGKTELRTAAFDIIGPEPGSTGLP